MTWCEVRVQLRILKWISLPKIISQYQRPLSPTCLFVENMAAARISQIHSSPLNNHQFHLIPDRRTPNFPIVSLPFSSSQNLSVSPLQTNFLKPNLVERFHLYSTGGNGGDRIGRGGSGGGRGSGSGGENGESSDGGDSHDSSSSSSNGLGIIGLFLEGWRSRVAADPQFPFKVLMEELVGVSSCVLGDMASRPNFGLNELDFVFSTLVVGCILNFTLMYLLAPTASSSVSNLPALFANCPKSHMFEPGSFTFMNRVGTFVYKGAVFAAVGFAAGLVGTAISNGLIAVRKKMDPEFETPNKAPPTLLNALTWAAHMGISSNLRYQSVNGLEFVLEKGLPPVVFKTSVIGLRCLNNVLGGMSFVVLARLTGSQSVEAKPEAIVAGTVAEKEKLVDGDDQPISSK